MIQQPEIQVEVFGDNVVDDVRHHFAQCKAELKSKQFVKSALALLRIQVGFPRLFFVAPKVEPIKINLTPGDQESSKPKPRGKRKYY